MTLRELLHSFRKTEEFSPDATDLFRGYQHGWNAALSALETHFEELYPPCIGYPDCDGDLVATPHSRKCTAFKEAEGEDADAYYGKIDEGASS